MIQKIRNLDPVYYVLYCIFIVFLKYVYFVFVNPDSKQTGGRTNENNGKQHADIQLGTPFLSEGVCDMRVYISLFVFSLGSLQLSTIHITHIHKHLHYSLPSTESNLE